MPVFRNGLDYLMWLRMAFSYANEICTRRRFSLSWGLVDGMGYDASSSVGAGYRCSRRRCRAALEQVRKKGWDRRRENRLPGLSGGGLVAQVSRVKPYLRQERWLLAPRWGDTCATYFVKGLCRGQISISGERERPKVFEPFRSNGKRAL
jgi:hypothetical protein